LPSIHKALIASGEAQPFEPQPKRVWKEWVQVGGEMSAHQALFEEAVQYVAENS
jgi:hypothetical protein